MKTKLLFLISFMITAACLAQNGINYKALIKDGVGNVVANDLITIQFQILQGAGMNNVYQETHTPTTDANGIAIVSIGEGTVDSGVFDAINWGLDDYFLNVQIDTGGGLTDMGTTEFKAVPYALASADNRWSKNINGINTANNAVGINSVNPEHTLDVRSTSQSEASQFNLSNNDKSRNIRFFSGNNTFPNPAISWAPGNDLLYATFDDNTSVFNELMRITSNGNVGIGSQNPDSSAILQVDSDNQGILIPRLTSSQINQIVSPEFSLLVYQTDISPGFYYNAGTSVQPIWKKIGDEPPTQGRFSLHYGPGNTNFVVPVGVTRIYFEMVGGGGGRGGTYLVSGGANRGGGGGGGGGFATGYIDVTPGEVLALTVGARGAFGTSGSPGSPGTAGELSEISIGGSILVQTSGGSQGDTATSSAAGFGGSGGTITEVNSSRVKLTCNIWSAVAGSGGFTADAADSLDIGGTSGCVNSPGIFNRLHSFSSSLIVSGGTVSVILHERILPYYGVGGGRNHGAQGGYIVLNW